MIRIVESKPSNRNIKSNHYNNKHDNENKYYINIKDIISCLKSLQIHTIFTLADNNHFMFI